jgi:hypothetical protein
MVQKSFVAMADAFAGKPAPTGIVIARTVWKPACRRWGRQNVSKIPESRFCHLLLHPDQQLRSTFQQLPQQCLIFIHIAFVLRQVASFMAKGE